MDRKVPEIVPTAPSWWPEDRPPQRLHAGYIYRGNDKHWHHADGMIASRAERRKAGVSYG